MAFVNETEHSIRLSAWTMKAFAFFYSHFLTVISTTLAIYIPFIIIISRDYAPMEQ